MMKDYIRKTMSSTAMCWLLVPIGELEHSSHVLFWSDKGTAALASPYAVD